MLPFQSKESPRDENPSDFYRVYPQMRGSTGCYAAKLVQALRSRGDRIEVDVVCNEEDGNDEFRGISPTNERNSDVLLKIVEKTPDPMLFMYSLSRSLWADTGFKKSPG
jgi:hypothetical protein